MATDTEALLARLLAEKAPTSRRKFLSGALQAALGITFVAAGLWYADGLTIEPLSNTAGEQPALVVLTQAPIAPLLAPRPTQVRLVVPPAAAPAVPFAQPQIAVDPTAVPVVAEPVVEPQPVLAPSLGHVSNEQSVVSEQKGGQMGMPTLHRREWNGGGNSDKKGDRMGIPNEGEGQ